MVPSTTNNPPPTKEIQWHSTWLDAMLCPLTKKPFQAAQITNCESHHSFSLASIQQLFGDTQAETGLCERPGLCPLSTCQKKVTAYWPNPGLQSLVNAALNPSILLKEVEPSEGKENEKKFPSSKLALKSTKNEWDENSYDLEIQVVESSVFKDLQLMCDRQRGGKGKKYSFGTHCVDEIATTELRLKLKQLGINATQFGKKYISFSTNEQSDFLKILSFLSSHSEFDPSLSAEFERFRAEVEAGRPAKGTSILYMTEDLYITEDDV